MTLRVEFRRRGDGVVRGLLGRIAGRTETDGIDAVHLGRVLLLVAMALVAVGVPALDTDGNGLQQAGVAVGGVSVALLASFLIRWDRISARATLAFPVIVFGLLVLLSVTGAPDFAPLAGLLSLCFAYIGLTQPPRTALAMLPFAGFAFVLISGGWSAAVVIRLLIGSFVWSILGEMLAHLRVKQETLADELRKAAHLDALTGVANRRDLALRLATVEPGDAVVLCDLDHFKRLNDTEGHHVGDQVLADFGSMLRATLRGHDYCARYGGEEFVLILPATSMDEARTTLARMHEHWAVLRPATTFSAGIAACSVDRAHTESLAAADGALYEAKAAGRNCDRVEASVSAPSGPSAPSTPSASEPAPVPSHAA